MKDKHKCIQKKLDKHPINYQIQKKCLFEMFIKAFLLHDILFFGLFLSILYKIEPKYVIKVNINENLIFTKNKKRKNKIKYITQK